MRIDTLLPPCPGAALPQTLRGWLLLTLLLILPGAFAQDAADGAPAAADQPPPIPDTLASPRATMETYLAAMRAVAEGDDSAIAGAVATLDLSQVNPLVRREKGKELAYTLKEVLDRTRVPDTSRFSTRKSGAPFVFQTYDSGPVAITFIDGQGWRFSADTVAALPAIFEEVADRDKVEGADQGSYLPLYLRIRSQLSESWRNRDFILERWQWAGILAIVVVGVVLDKLVSLLLSVFVGAWSRRYAAGAFRALDHDVLRPFGLMAMALAWWAGLNLLGLPDGTLAVLLISVKFLACLSAVWGAYRLVDVTGAFLQNRADQTANKLDDALVPLVTRTLKIFVTVLGIIFIADNLDVDVTSLLAGLGIGGLAFALAAKDVAGNLFGSITVLMDQTFHPGDWVVIGDVEGTVERIGFRSTRIRTFYDSQVTVPNQALITANVDNLGNRRYRRYKANFSIAYDTPPERIDAFCEGLREIVRQHPYMRKESFHVYLNDLGASGLDILIYVFWETPDWATELRERHRFLLDALRLARRLGVEYAFPTQTLYMKRGEETPLPQEPEHIGEAGEKAMAEGRMAARAIVEATSGLGVKPPPVSFFTGKQDEGS